MTWRLVLPLRCVLHFPVDITHPVTFFRQHALVLPLVSAPSSSNRRRYLCSFRFCFSFGASAVGLGCDYLMHSTRRRGYEKAKCKCCPGGTGQFSVLAKPNGPGSATQQTSIFARHSSTPRCCLPGHGVSLTQISRSVVAEAHSTEKVTGC